jgi:hypothetical protein
MTTPFRYRLEVEKTPAELTHSGRAEYTRWGPYTDSTTGGAETHARELSDKLGNATVWIVPVGDKHMRRWWVRVR